MASALTVALLLKKTSAKTSLNQAGKQSGTHRLFESAAASMDNNDLFIDIETYSSVDIAECGSYKYIESDDFEILIIGYAFGNNDVVIVDLACGDEIPEEFEEALLNPEVRKHAHNAVFERTAFKRVGYDTPVEQWYCTMVKSAYCGLPLSLDQVSKKLDLTQKKLETGKLLIKYFSCPCKPTRTNGYRTRNYPEDAPEQWEMYKEYNKYDVLSEREIYQRLEQYEIPEFERQLYILDQHINDRGILVDMELAESAIYCDQQYTEELTNVAQALTGLENPNSVTQLRNWIYERTGEQCASLAKDIIEPLIQKYKDYDDVVEVLQIRQKLSKTSVKKYYAMLNCAMKDNRARGTFQFYGASRTGRWAGRLLQLQNLSKNHTDDIELYRDLVRKRDWDLVDMLSGNVSDILSQLVRTALIAPEGMTFAVADFSAIEARVVSWLADEEWRLDVFRGDGKIYEAAGARMFNVPIESITKGSDLRARAKNAELALGYEGSLGAMKRMGGDKLGMTDTEMMDIVRKWRKANPKIVALWEEMQECAFEAVRYQRPVTGSVRNLVFDCNGDYMTIQLPAGRKLFYCRPHFKDVSPSGRVSKTLYYEGLDQKTKQWLSTDLYGGKITENIVQAIARDLIGYAMLQLENNGYGITMHVHDEAIAEIPADGHEQEYYNNMVKLMSTPPDWAADLPLNADGYITPFYKKD